MSLKIGMLWYSPRLGADLAGELARAVEYYAGKYGTAPNTAIVNPSQAQPCELNGLTVKTAKTIQRNHVFIGVAELAKI